ncbi:protein containing DUF1987 [sediment metagenome]|uniref:Protein containing DUF1987 n=1 Tax=sediment metagenome TaxID=749907 RepID=D9PI79_9ZZZZ
MGVSLPENAREFFGPLMKAVEEYASAPRPSTKIDIGLDYFNTSSSKVLTVILKLMESVNAMDGYSVSVNWYYDEDDDDMLDEMNNFKDMFKLQFTPITK